MDKLKQCQSLTAQRDEAVGLLNEFIRYQFAYRHISDLGLWICPYCKRVDNLASDNISHDLDCPVTKARELLAKIEKGG